MLTENNAGSRKESQGEEECDESTGNVGENSNAEAELRTNRSVDAISTMECTAGDDNGDSTVAQSKKEDEGVEHTQADICETGLCESDILEKMLANMGTDTSETENISVEKCAYVDWDDEDAYDLALTSEPECDTKEPEAMFCCPADHVEILTRLSCGCSHRTAARRISRPSSHKHLINRLSRQSLVLETPSRSMSSTQASDSSRLYYIPTTSSASSVKNGEKSLGKTRGGKDDEEKDQSVVEGQQSDVISNCEEKEASRALLAAKRTHTNRNDVDHSPVLSHPEKVGGVGNDENMMKENVDDCSQQGLNSNGSEDSPCTQETVIVTRARDSLGTPDTTQPTRPHDSHCEHSAFSKQQTKASASVRNFKERSLSSRLCNIL